MTIGTGSGGTVTLAQDQTINSLSITKGYTLSGANHSITTNGNVSVASGAALSLHDMNVGGVFTDSGSVTLAGVLTINKGGRLTLSNGSFTGGINGSGTFQTNAGTTGTLKNVTILRRHDIYGEQQRDHRHFGRDRRQWHAPGERRRRDRRDIESDRGYDPERRRLVSLTTTKGGGSAIVEGAG